MIYQQGYKYKLAFDERIEVPFRDKIPLEFYDNGFIMYDYGWLLIRKGYAWDGTSGPIIDTKNNMFPSLVHDAWYQLLREGGMPQSTKVYADRWFGDLCHERGTYKIITDVYVEGLILYGSKAAHTPRPYITVH